MKRHPQLAMTDYDLAELYRYLLLFKKTYDDCEKDVEKLSEIVREIFLEQSGLSEEKALDELKNPRHAGRKSSVDPEKESAIRKMRKDGVSIRNISEQVKVSKSTVQRILSSH